MSGSETLENLVYVQIEYLFSRVYYSVFHYTKEHVEERMDDLTARAGYQLSFLSFMIRHDKRYAIDRLWNRDA